MAPQAPQPRGAGWDERDVENERTFRFALALVHADDTPRHVATAELSRPTGAHSRRAHISGVAGAAHIGDAGSAQDARDA
eukprot:15791324-Heterocapsa_arctica.AAC.1